ncbi:MAG: NADH-quinone oxidoreductase subunit D [Nitrospirota bacterium]|nr:NADH-quinone oxidoreductase subunit D [Nitrospirota bacterium]
MQPFELTDLGAGTKEMMLNMGPQHPSTHGVIKFVLRMDGEVVSALDPDVGFLHRSIEKIAEKLPYPDFMPYTDRVDYVAAMNCNFGYARVVEKLMKMEVPKRAEYIRVIAAELNRISSHLVSVGTFGNDIGAVTPFLYAIRDRELINDLLEMLCGARLTYNFVRIGGVAFDLPDTFKEKAIAFLDTLEPKLKEFNALLSENRIFRERLAGVCVISKEDAVAYGVTGPNLRGSGVDWDLRRDEPYSVYPEVSFEVPVGGGLVGKVGDAFDRYWVRIKEMQESAKIVRQCLGQIPEGPIMAKVPRVLKPPAGDAFDRTEAPRGELGYYLVSDGSSKPQRLKIRTGSFAAVSIIPKIAPGWMIADIVALIGSLDIIAPEIDR